MKSRNPPTLDGTKKIDVNSQKKKQKLLNKSIVMQVTTHTNKKPSVQQSGFNKIDIAMIGNKKYVFEYATDTVIALSVEKMFVCSNSIKKYFNRIKQHTNKIFKLYIIKSGVQLFLCRDCVGDNRRK